MPRAKRVRGDVRESPERREVHVTWCRNRNLQFPPSLTSKFGLDNRPHDSDSGTSKYPSPSFHPEGCVLAARAVSCRPGSQADATEIQFGLELIKVFQQLEAHKYIVSQSNIQNDRRHRNIRNTSGSVESVSRKQLRADYQRERKPGILRSVFVLIQPGADSFSLQSRYYGKSIQ
ncbi:hypothetical protein F2P81_009918 [Scophthalmus maximus]|uniref:Uncharacterized protein n=1 Tax=Scophthalmus maximus TaxID=52904 RepID=A0A6A4T1B3_SCOMX|nr:hypothetical protein F2P81_009918 [Scophthalmus maximus]